jgi:hypothetical protein
MAMGWVVFACSTRRKSGAGLHRFEARITASNGVIISSVALGGCADKDRKGLSHSEIGIKKHMQKQLLNEIFGSGNMHADLQHTPKKGFGPSFT